MSILVKRVLFVLMPNDYQDVEFLEPYEIIKNSGHHATVASLESGICVGTQGHKQVPDIELSDLSTQEFDAFDALVIPGGKGSSEYLWDNEHLQDVVRYFHDNKKIVAAICYAVIVPVQSGLLQGKHATVYPTQEAKSILADYGVFFVDEECVVLSEEKIITAQGPKFAQTFGNAIVNLLQTGS